MRETFGKASEWGFGVCWNKQPFALNDLQDGVRLAFD
jgi:hypothetical protein